MSSCHTRNVIVITDNNLKWRIGKILVSFHYFFLFSVSCLLKFYCKKQFFLLGIPRKRNKENRHSLIISSLGHTYSIYSILHSARTMQCAQSYNTFSHKFNSMIVEVVFKEKRFLSDFRKQIQNYPVYFKQSRRDGRKDWLTQIIWWMYVYLYIV